MKAKKIIFTALAVLFQIALSSLAFAKPYGEKSRADNDQAFIDACNNLMKNMVYQKVMTDMFHLKC